MNNFTETLKTNKKKFVFYRNMAMLFFKFEMKPTGKEFLLTRYQYPGNKELENLILQGIINAQEEFNIKSTPSFIINGKLLEGNKPIKDFRQIIDKILSE